jgi:predicted aldo/keto reductase-like oxidoreductase
MKIDGRGSRRSFLKGLAGGAALWGVSLSGLAGNSGRVPRRNAEPGLPRRRLGRTGLLVSEISLGSSPLPDPYLTRTLVDRGINYIDSSHNYENGNSERKIGRLLKEVGRDKIYVGTKFHVTAQDTEKTILDSVHGSLRRLGTDHVDVLLIHGAESADVLDDERVLGAYERLKKEGAFRFRGLSCHSNHEEVVRKAVGCGLYDMVQVGYNVFDILEGETPVETYPDYLGTSGIRGLLELARSRDVGIIAMKTLKVGGRRQDLGRYRTGTTSLYQAMIKWVLEDSRVASALIEIMSHREMEEDLAAADSALTAAERETLARYVGENGTDYCHLCGRCARACPEGIATTGILHALAYHESYGKKDRARRTYAGLPAEKTAASCRDCGTCEKVCPFGVAVRSKIRAAHFLLA